MTLKIDVMQILVQVIIELIGTQEIMKDIAAVMMVLQIQ